MVVFKIITVLGIAAYSMVLITVISGLARKRFHHKKWIKFHLSFAVSACVLASTHAVLVFINY